MTGRSCVEAPASLSFLAVIELAVGGHPSAPNAYGVLNLPRATSSALPSRGMVSVRGSFAGRALATTLCPDGSGGHRLFVGRSLCVAAGVGEGDEVEVTVTPLAAGDEPEPAVPEDLRRAILGAPERARETWGDITPIARRDWIQWITSGKKAGTRVVRIIKACDMLAKGKRRPCCFDRTGMYGRGTRKA